MNTLMTQKEAMLRHPLAHAVFKQLGGSGDEEIEPAKQAGEHGADAGWNGFTYYHDTCAFVKKNRSAIASAVESMAEELGEEPIAMVKGFNCLKSHDITSRDVALALYGGFVRRDDEAGVQLVENALAWFALEEVGRALGQE